MTDRFALAYADSPGDLPTRSPGMHEYDVIGE